LARYIVLKYPRRGLPFTPRIDLYKGRVYCQLAVDLWRTPFKISEKGIEELSRFIVEYSSKRGVRNRYCALNGDIVSFRIRCVDLGEVLERVLEIISRNLEPCKQLAIKGSWKDATQH
jgi:hypothetical protein